MTSCFRDIRVWSRRVLLNFCWISILIDILIANISITVAQTPINYTIFWNSVMRTFRCIYVNCFNNFGFLLSSAQDCKKYTLLDNLRTITQERNMETRQMAPFFSSTFFALTFCNIHSYIWKNSKFIFYMVLLWPILVCKIP